MSIYDQFEQVSERSKSNYSNVEMGTSGYLQMSMEQELPIFTKSKKDFTPADKITHVAISNKYMVIAMANHVLFRMNMQNPSQQDEISLAKYKESYMLMNLFMDPYGNHILLTFLPLKDNMGPELVYLSRKSQKLKSTTKFRGHEITAVAWNYSDNTDSTGSILLGTSKGLIFETEITSEGDKFFTAGFELYLKQVIDIGKGTLIPITGLEFYNIPYEAKYVVFATTPNRLYIFNGPVNLDEKPLLYQVFNKYLSIPENETYMKVDNDLKFSKIKFWSKELSLPPSSLAFMTGKGITFSQFDPFAADILKSIEDNKSHIQFKHSTSDTFIFPFTLTLTQFHVLVAYVDAVHGICVLNSDHIYEGTYNQAFGSLVNVVKDEITGSIWAVTENALFRYRVTKEDRDVWHIYCEKGNFALAKQYSADNEVCLNQVLIKEAKKLFENGDYNLSAESYAETQSSFEEICLKFIEINQQDALKIFLKKKLHKLKSEDNTQISLIVLFLVELFSNQLEDMRLHDKEQTQAYFELQKEFEQFMSLKKVAQNVKANKLSVYKLLSSHGDKVNMTRLTKIHKDFEQMIRQAIYKNSFLDALNILKSQDNKELFYKFAPILIQEIPIPMVRAIKEQGRYLHPDKLLPALVSCDSEEHSREIIKYLEFCTKELHCTEKAIHNLLLSLYAKYDTKALMNYLNSQGQGGSMVNYDVCFALRLCQEKQLTEACVVLSSILGLWETAVDMALKISKDLAMKIANQPLQSEVELRKKLWLKIAKQVVSGNDDIQNAMDFLQQCDLIKIEDILPFFSDFVTIDHFRDAICNSLKEYNQHIEDLKEDMEEATKSTELVRKEIQSFKNKHTNITRNDSCEICQISLMIRPFYIFPCNHRFHSDCLLRELNPMLGPARRTQLSELQRQLNILNGQTIDNISTGSTGMSARDTVKAEIDNIIASECLYCGENMIRNISEPFIDENEYDNVLKEWD